MLTKVPGAANVNQKDLKLLFSHGKIALEGLKELVPERDGDMQGVKQPMSVACDSHMIP